MDIHELCEALGVKPRKNGYLSRADLLKFRGKMEKGVSSSGLATDTWNVLTELQRAGLVKSFKHGATGYVYGCRCQVCVAVKKVKARKSTTTTKNKAHQASKRRRNQRIKKGLCRDCSQPVAPGRARCFYHLEYYTKYYEERRNLYYDKW